MEVPAPSPTTPGTDPGHDCPLCPRLVEYRLDNRAAHPDWHNGPVPSWGPRDAGLLVLGLAPGVRGANRTGRPFTGDYAGRLLYATLVAHGLARGDYAEHPEDGLVMVGARVTNSARCVPPQNLPTTAEVRTCNRFLQAEIAAMPRLRVVLALGTVAHDALLRARGLRLSAHRFRHGAVHELDGSLALADSYHVSRYNTSTRVLTPAMFDDVVRNIVERLATSQP